MAKEKPALTVTNQARATSYSPADVDSMPQAQATLSTIWGIGGRWQGVSLAELLRRSGDTSRKLTLVATNDYAVEIDRAAVDSEQPMLATHLNGQRLTPETKGPYMLIWPKSAASVLAGQGEPARWVWSVTEIVGSD